MKTEQTLCWRCKKSYLGGCDWADDFRPVEGWNATRKDIHSSDHKTFESYVVHDCPKFERG